MLCLPGAPLCCAADATEEVKEAHKIFDEAVITVK